MLVAFFLATQDHGLFQREALIVGALALLAIHATYLIIDGESVVWVRMLVFRKRASISRVTLIRMGTLSGVWRSPTVFIDYASRWGTHASVGVDIDFYGLASVRSLVGAIRAIRSDVPLDGGCRRLLLTTPKTVPQALSIKWFSSLKKEIVEAMFPNRERR